jgi:hypothetical protein
LKEFYDVMVSIAETICAFNTSFDSVNPQRPTERIPSSNSGAHVKVSTASPSLERRTLKLKARFESLPPHFGCKR